jgi:hypothetical protein
MSKESYMFAEVSERKAKKIFENTQIQDKVMETLKNEGKVFANHEKKDLICYYIFERVKWENDEAENKESYIYQLVEEFYKPEKEKFRNVFENTIRICLTESIAFGMADAVIWNEDVYVLKKKKKQSISIAGLITGGLLGLSFGYSLDNTGIGVSMAFLWAMIYNMLFTAEERKLVKRGE